MEAFRSISSVLLLAIGVLVLWYAIERQARSNRGWRLIYAAPIAILVAVLWSLSFRIGFGEGSGEGGSGSSAGDRSDAAGGVAVESGKNAEYRIDAARLPDGALALSVTGPGLRETLKHLVDRPHSWDSSGLKKAMTASGAAIAEQVTVLVSASPSLSAAGRDALRDLLEREGFMVRFTDNGR